MAKTKTPRTKKAKSLDNKAETPLSEKSKLQMKALPPKKEGLKKAVKEARAALASGDVLTDVTERKKQQDARTLYLRFSDNLPNSADEIKEIHSDIKFVRMPRKANKKGEGVSYAFVEFGDPEECKTAKNKISTSQFKGKEIFVDFVGEMSKNKNKSEKAKVELNPFRLFVCGLTPAVSQENLKEMFPKAARAEIPQTSRKKGKTFGFVQFSNTADAKAAFDAAQNLKINEHPITVLFAKKTPKTEAQIAKQKSKAEKRKAKESDKDKDSKKIKSDNKENVAAKKLLVDRHDSEGESDTDEELDDTVKDEEEEQEMELKPTVDVTNTVSNKDGDEVKCGKEDDDENDDDDDDDDEDDEEIEKKVENTGDGNKVDDADDDDADDDDDDEDDDDEVNDDEDDEDDTETKSENIGDGEEGEGDEDDDLVDGDEDDE